METEYKFKTYFYVNDDGDFYCDRLYENETMYTKSLEKAQELIEKRLNSVIGSIDIDKKYSFRCTVLDLIDSAMESFIIERDSGSIKAEEEYCYIASNGNYDIEIGIERVKEENKVYYD